MKLSYSVKLTIKPKTLIAPVGKLQKVVDFYANEIRNETIDNVYAHNLVDTGRLVGSVAVSSGPLQAKIGPDVTYAIYHELGTKYIKARPFLMPAYQKIKPDFVKAIEKVL